MPISRFSQRFSHSARFFSCVLCLGVFLATGCGDGSEVGKVVPVSGHVTLDGKPLPGGAVNFTPDASKGNTLQFTPSGRIQSDGTYTANTGNKVGVPPGWYKITVLANQPGSPSIPVKINSRYSEAGTTPFSVQVTETTPASDYDLPLKK